MSSFLNVDIITVSILTN